MSEMEGHGHDYYSRASKINREVWAFFERRPLTAEPRYVQYRLEAAPAADR